MNHQQPTPSVVDSYLTNIANAPIEPVRTGPIPLQQRPTEVRYEEENSSTPASTSATPVVDRGLETQTIPVQYDPMEIATRRLRFYKIIQLNAEAIDYYLTMVLSDMPWAVEKALGVLGNMIKIDVKNKPHIAVLLLLRTFSDDSFDELWVAMKDAATWIDGG